MGVIKTYFGQPSYTNENKHISIYISIQGGNMVATFKNREKEINPFFVAPWWNEARIDNGEGLISNLRGEFFCFPFGGNAESYEGKKYLLHGQSANDNWEFVSLSDGTSDKELVLKMDLDDRGSILKSVKITDDEPVIYINNTISKFEGKAPFGYHPTLRLPEKLGSVIVDFSKPVACFTPPFPVEEPQNGGYSLLKPGHEIRDFTKVPCVDGSTVDLTRCPICKGFEDVAILISDGREDLAFTAVSFSEEGYLYFQLKNPKVLSGTLLWMSNGGRHYSPWNGRVHSVMGVEEVTAFFHYGIKPSVESNFLQEKGYKTYKEFKKESTTDIKLIIGLIPIDKSFKGVKSIHPKDDSTITIIGKGDEVIDVPCKSNFVID